MLASLRTVARSFAALFSSLVLLGPLTFGLLVGAAAPLLDATGLVIPDSAVVAGIAVAALAGLWMVIEGTAIQLYGLEIVDRGGPRQRGARYLLLGLTTVAGVIVAVRFLALAIPWAIDTGNVFAQVLGALIVAALVGTSYRTITAIWHGYSSATEEC